MLNQEFIQPVCGLEEEVTRAMWEAREQTLPADMRVSFGDTSTGDIFVMARAAIAAHLAAITAAGYAIVPREPTSAMCDAATRSTSAWLNSGLRGIELRRLKLRIRWTAMLAAAPAYPPTEPVNPGTAPNTDPTTKES